MRGPAGAPVGRGGPALRELQQGAAASQQDSVARPHQPSAQLSGSPATGGQPGLPAAPKTQASLTQGQRGELTRENSNKSSSSQTLPPAFSAGARKLAARLSTAAPDDGSREKSWLDPCWLTYRRTVLSLIAFFFFFSEEEDVCRGR